MEITKQYRVSVKGVFHIRVRAVGEFGYPQNE